MPRAVGLLVARLGGFAIAVIVSGIVAFLLTAMRSDLIAVPVILLISAVPYTLFGATASLLRRTRGAAAAQAPVVASGILLAASEWWLYYRLYVLPSKGTDAVLGAIVPIAQVVLLIPGGIALGLFANRLSAKARAS